MSLDAHWHRMTQTTTQRVDLLAWYPNSPITATGTIKPFDQNPIVIIKDAILNQDAAGWLYLDNAGVDVPIPTACRPLAWRPAQLRAEAVGRATEIERMLDLLRTAPTFDTESYIRAEDVAISLREAVGDDTVRTIPWVRPCFGEAADVVRAVF
jgi:hypothetical protein